MSLLKGSGKLKRLLKKCGATLLLSFLMLPLVATVQAQISVPIIGGQEIIDSGDVVTTPDVEALATGQGDQLQSFNIFEDIFYRLVKAALIVTQAITVFYMVFVGSLMVTTAGNEDSLKKHQMTMIYIVIGFLVLSLGDNLIEIFNPVYTNEAGGVEVRQDEVYNFDAWQAYVLIIVDIIRYILWTVAVVIIVIIGVQMFLSKEKDTSKQRKNLTWVGIGLFITQIAHLIIEPFLSGDARTGVRITTNPDGSTKVEQIQQGAEIAASARVEAGNELLLQIADVILTVFAPLSIFGLILGGFYLVTGQGDQEKVTRARKIIIGSVIAIIIAFSSYTLVRTVATGAASFDTANQSFNAITNP